MVDTSFLPTLSPFDVERAIQLIQQAYAPSQPTITTSEDLRRLQQELFEIQKRPEAWGLVIPLLDHSDQNVQFFGAHTAQVKIARDWDSFPKDHAEALRDVMVQLAAHSTAIHRPKFILRKLFVALTSLALKLVPGSQTRWPDWILSCITSFSGRGATQEDIHDFLAIVAEEMSSADLIGQSKLQMQQSLMDATSMVAEAIQTSINPTKPLAPQELQSALKCFQAWLQIMELDLITPIIPMLIALLDPSAPDETCFLAASDSLQEIMSKSPLADGAGTRTLTEPLLLWLDAFGAQIVNSVLSSGDVTDIAHSLCKLLAAMGDHSSLYLAANLASPVMVTGSSPPILQGLAKSRAHLVQNYLKMMLAYTGMPGSYGVDEEESDITLGFWYLFQEALWSTDFDLGEEEVQDPGEKPLLNKENEAITIAKAAYTELVQVLRRKVTFPGAGSGWTKDQVDKFLVYRRDVGDTLINAYYVLRDDMLVYYVNDVAERLATRTEDQPWQDIEATLHCIMSIQEALEFEKSPHLARLFEPTILGKLPSAGLGRIRRTTLSLIGAYSSWFATQSDAESTTPLLMNVVGYVVSALTDPSLCLQAASALRNLCDANRKTLAPQIAAFAELHAGLERIPDSERSKVLQSISSVIQALPPEEEVSPVAAIISPIVQKLGDALRSSTTLPDEARATAILQLDILSGVAKGLTRTSDVNSTDDSPELQAELKKIEAARENPQIVKLRDDIYAAIRHIMELWSTDAEVSQALSDLFKSITSLPPDITLISLGGGPMIELVCLAVQRQLTATWLSLFAILTAQLNPPPAFINLSIKLGPSPEAEAIMRSALPLVLQCALGVLAQPGAMESNPDIVQEFFASMDRAAQDFTSAFYSLPDGALTTLLQCAVSSLGLQERYSLVAACTFLATLIHRSTVHSELIPARDQVMNDHGQAIVKAILWGFAGVAPRSAVNNLVDLLGAIVVRCEPRLVSSWINNVLLSPDFVESKATLQSKETFMKAILGTRSLKRIRDAANQFMLISRGLDGTSFGYTSLTM
ncbi:ARM repeat-containing protein [Pluteus cervinus]|uniref:ARM repeat-containing protein n=1 Tax=Pluteus cervinus TaxID=181527 RepID=A0ACD3B4T3_9AGAR|nr:ARM repeat-containing protein [Pluteus cervinus]